MSQVAIIIDAPDHSVEELQGSTLLRIAEDVARQVRMQVPVDDRVRVHAVVQGEDLVVTDASAEPDDIEYDDGDWEPEPQPTNPNGSLIPTPDSE